MKRPFSTAMIAVVLLIPAVWFLAAFLWFMIRLGNISMQPLARAGYKLSNVDITMIHARMGSGN